MQKSFLLFFIIFFNSVVGVAQTDTLSATDKALLDSMLANDPFLNMLSEKEGSYFDINIGMGNSIFSEKNNTLNAEQAETKKIFFTPSVGYYNKSGLGIAFTGYLSNDKGKASIYQYAINPFYNYADKKVEAGLSYTRYLPGTSVSSFSISPYTNDVYANVKLKKPWLQPGLALGFANGKFEEYFDSTFIINPPSGPRLVRITDTITTRLKDFSIIFSIEHEFNFLKLFSTRDQLMLVPAIMLNGSSQNWNIAHSNSINKRSPGVQNLLKRNYGNGNVNVPFQLQSIAFLTQATYSLANFYLLPQVYLDYYLPQSNSQKLTAVYSITAGITF